MTTLTPTNVRAVSILLRYTDGGNWKQSESFILSNPDNIPFDEIKAAFDVIGEEDVIPLQWGLPSLSEITHEDIEIVHNSEQHCYHSLEDLEPISDADYHAVCKEMTKADSTLTTILAAVKRGQSEEYEALGKTLKTAKINQAKKILEENNHHVFTQFDMDTMTDRILPFGIDRALLLTVAKVGLSNNALISFLTNKMTVKESDLRELQTGLARISGD
jgi:hypothetical protein